MIELSCSHGVSQWGDCAKCGRKPRERDDHLPLADGAADLLKAALDRALQVGPNSPDFKRRHMDAAVVVAAATDGRLRDALCHLARLDAGGGDWSLLADLVRLLAGVALAYRSAVRGDVARGLRIVERLLARLRAW